VLLKELNLAHFTIGKNGKDMFTGKDPLQELKEFSAFLSKKFSKRLSLA